MKPFALALSITLIGLLSGCAISPQNRDLDHLFNDKLFAPPTTKVNADDVFAVSSEMRHYLKVQIADQLRNKGPQQGLIDALSSKNQLKVEYDAAETRNAAETFRDRAGNCLSLTIMTAALAKELGMQVHYQSVFVDESWSRSGGLYFSIGHVNLTIGKRYHDIKTKIDDNIAITIDFNPPVENKSYHTWPIREGTVVAMFMNNRSAEALARGEVDNAYWLAREAIRQDPKFASAYNTLGVAYRRHGNLMEAERVLLQAMAIEPGNTQIMSNLAVVLKDQGRESEAGTLVAKVERRQPYAPFHFFHLGQDAMKAGDFKTARDLFTREIDRDPYNHEFHFWLAAAYLQLRNYPLSRKHLGIAMDFSPTRNQHNVYASKLDRLQAYQ
ncbi:MAG: tetratricopeptide repeat protein [Betaproteobacteria bacterium]|nr:tetratricopeptide repeat protein [Betaproteobacteria bacterium]